MLLHFKFGHQAPAAVWLAICYSNTFKLLVEWDSVYSFSKSLFLCADISPVLLSKLSTATMPLLTNQGTDSALCRWTNFFWAVWAGLVMWPDSARAASSARARWRCVWTALDETDHPKHSYSSPHISIHSSSHFHFDFSQHYLLKWNFPLPEHKLGPSL